MLALEGVNISDMIEHSKLTPHFLANFLPTHLFQEDVNLTHFIMSNPPYYSQCRMVHGPKSQPTLHTPISNGNIQADVKAWCEKVDVNYRWDELGVGCYMVCTTSPSIDRMSVSTMWTCGLIDLSYHVFSVAFSLVQEDLDDLKHGL